MIKYFKLINWKKLTLYTVIFAMVLTILYINSIVRGDNVYPDNAWIIPVGVVLWVLALFFNAFTVFIERTVKQTGKIDNYQ